MSIRQTIPLLGKDCHKFYVQIFTKLPLQFHERNYSGTKCKMCASIRNLMKKLEQIWKATFYAMPLMSGHKTFDVKCALRP